MLQVLFVIRDNFETVLGGDSIQMKRTAESLRARGVSVEVQTAGNLRLDRAYDLAHVFNIQTFAESFLAMEKLRDRGIPIALSTIYWDTFDHMADMAGSDHRIWSQVRKLLGRTRFRQFYIARMQAKLRQTEEFRVQALLLDGADVLLPNSLSEGALLNELFERDFTAKTFPIVNAIATELYPPKAPSDFLKKTLGIERPILQVGRISSVKNQLRVIEALQGTSIPLVFVGQVEHDDYARRCRAEGERRGNTHFIERLPHDELPGIYASAKVHVLPSWRETPGLVSLEAAAAGCQIVTTSIGSTRDYFGDDARYVFPDDVIGLRSALLAAYEAPANAALQERILREFTWSRTAEQTLDAYQRVVGRAPAPLLKNAS